MTTFICEFSPSIETSLVVLPLFSICRSSMSFPSLSLTSGGRTIWSCTGKDKGACASRWIAKFVRPASRGGARSSTVSETGSLTLAWTPALGGASCFEREGSFVHPQIDKVTIRGTLRRSFSVPIKFVNVLPLVL